MRWQPRRSLCRATWIGFFLAALALAQPGVAKAQISPGPLARAHAQLDGTLQCTKCHAGGKDVSARCLACHREIAWVLERNRGFHPSQSGTPCAACHPDHAGSGFALIKWPDSSYRQFDHRRAGWALEGKHGAIQCEDCHRPEYARSPAAGLRPGPAAGPTWVGLEPDCLSCHEDVHRGALKQRCTSCHGFAGWKPAPRFDHAQTNYPLTGRHRTVGCASCHVTGGRAARGGALPLPVYRPVAHSQCSDCHRDPHAGRLGPGCASCHTTGGFRDINRETFDHDRTRFPLAGRHAGVACVSCHDFAIPRGTRPAFATCNACHEDPHGGNATLAGKPADCAACHSLQGFAPGVMALAQHQHTRFPLEGKHQTVRCGACHQQVTPGPGAAGLGPARVQLHPPFAECRSCHADDHGGQLASRPDQGACESCHQVAGWRPSTFAADRHTGLPLEGRHAEISCRACHGIERQGLPPIAAAGVGKAGVALVLVERECVACHVDPHRGRFAPGGPRSQGGSCSSCHDSRAFRPSTIDPAVHAGFGFALEGAHRAVACAACHADMKNGSRRGWLIKGPPATATLTLSVERQECAACHTSPHGDQFKHRPDGGACERCHGLDGFTPASRFEHDRDTAFPLKGAHATVACSRCHQTGVRTPGRQPQLVYAPLSTTCESCHGGPAAPARSRS